MYVVKNIQAEEDITVLDIVKFLKEHGTKKEQDEIKDILSLSDYDEELWTLSAI